MTKKTDDILPGYDRVVGQIIARYAAIREMLQTGNVVGAQAEMEELATYHAKQSLSLRNMMIRRGFILDTKPRDEC